MINKIMNNAYLVSVLYFALMCCI